MIYADHAATTMLSPKAREAMFPWLSEEYGNPSTLYSLARNPRKAIADARAKIAEAIKAKPDEILFTSCGTESDNWACWEQHCVFQTKGNASLRAVLSTMLFCILVNSLRNLGTKSYISLLIVSV